MILLRAQAIEAFETAIDYMDRIHKEIPLMVEYYKNNTITDVSDKMFDLSEGLYWIYDVVRLTTEYNSLVSSEIIDSYSEMNQAFENKEYILLADILQYELMPLIKAWRESLAGSLLNLTNN